jgi:DNA-binding SARP family transcriptional activator
MIHYRLLGPLEAVVDGRAVELPPGRPRALLARLLLVPGRVVPATVLVEALWGEAAPPSAPKVLQAHVSALRKVLGREAIETRPPGYALRVEPGATDLDRFESLVERARDTRDVGRRIELLGEALALWRGEPLAEFIHEPFAAAASARLADLRFDATMLRLDAELERGEDERLVPELRSLVAAEPLREQPRGRLMIALYRSGRQADALATYREGRRLLVQELGIEPGPELQELERAILRHDPTLGRVVPRRGPIVCAGELPLELVAPLANESRELLLIELVADAGELADAAARLRRRREQVTARAACFTSDDRAGDLARFAAEQGAELLLVGGGPEARLAHATPCDVAFAPRVDLAFVADGPIVVPFGGRREEWTALELAAWLGRAHGLPLRLVGSRGRAGGRDASRTLAAASLALQRFAGVAADPVLVEPGAEGVLAVEGAVIVVSAPGAVLDDARTTLVERARVPVLLAHPGLRPAGLAPDRTLTRFSWSLADG